jgi:hypothetical protein
MFIKTEFNIYKVESVSRDDNGKIISYIVGEMEAIRTNQVIKKSQKLEELFDGLTFGPLIDRRCAGRVTPSITGALINTPKGKKKVASYNELTKTFELLKNPNYFD